MGRHLIYILLAVTCSVWADPLAIDFNSLDDDGKNQINQLFEKYGDFNGLEADLNAENKDDCNTKKDIYAEAIKAYAEEKGDAAATTIQVSGKEFPLPVFDKGTPCVKITNEISFQNWLKNINQGDVKANIVNQAKATYSKATIEVQKREEVRKFLSDYQAYRAKLGESVAQNPQLAKSVEEIKKAVDDPRKSYDQWKQIVMTQGQNVWTQGMAMIRQRTSSMTGGKAATGDEIKAEGGPAAAPAAAEEAAAEPAAEA